MIKENDKDFGEKHASTANDNEEDDEFYSNKFHKEVKSPPIVRIRISRSSKQWEQSAVIREL